MIRLKAYARTVFRVCVTIPVVALTVMLLGLSLAAIRVSNE